MAHVKRNVPLYGSTSTLTSVVAEKQQALIKCRSNYYKPTYALELLPILLDMLGGKVEVIFETEVYGLQPNTLRLLITNAWAYLIEHGSDIQGMPKGIDWDGIKKLRTMVRITMLTTGVAITAKYRKIHELNKQTNTNWNNDLREWLEGDMENELVLDNLALTPDNIKMITTVLTGFPEVEYKMSPERLEVKRRKE